MRCIFCLEERESSDEHVFPFAIGGTLHIIRVCVNCNSILGSGPDAYLTNHILIRLRRFQLRLSGNSGKIPDWMEILGNGVLGANPEQRVKMSIDDKVGIRKLELIYNSKEIVLANGTTLKQIASSNIGEIETTLVRERKRTGLKPLNTDELSASVERIKKNDFARLENPEVKYSIVVDTKNFKKGIYKIAYELAFLWLGECYIDDPMAAIFRDTLLSGKDEFARQIVDKVEFGLNAELFQHWVEFVDCHVAYSRVIENKLFIFIKIFDIFSAAITVSQDAGRYVSAQYDRASIRFISIN
jgi:hypothetical protein